MTLPLPEPGTAPAPPPVSLPLTAATNVAGVIGAPVRHSLSPTLHNAAFAAAGLDWVFVAFEVPKGRGGAAVRGMKELGIRGLAVTTPHKEDVAYVVDEADRASRAFGSVNTVMLGDHGSTYGASTDGEGFVESLRSSDVDPSGAHVVILGAGGAARSIIHSLGGAGAERITVVNRTQDRAKSAARHADVARVGTIDDVRSADIVVNATSVGMGNDELPVDPELLGAAQIVADIVYHPIDTALLRAARQAGARTIDGIGMLVHQAALQQQMWTGHKPDPLVMRAAAEAELARRG